MKRLLLSIVLIFSFIFFAGSADYTKVYFKGYHLNAYQYPKKNAEGKYYPYYESVEQVKNYGTISIDEIKGVIQYKYISGEEFISKDIKKLIRFEFDPILGNIESIVYLGKWEENGIDFKLQFCKSSENEYIVKLFSKRNYDPSMLGGEFYSKEFKFITLGIVPEQL